MGYVQRDLLKIFSKAFFNMVEYDLMFMFGLNTRDRLFRVSTV